MSHVCEREAFTVTVNSGFISNWQWAVHAVVTYHPKAVGENRRDVEAEARVELLSGIARACRLGRAGGAHTVLVLVEGDREIAGFFRGLEDRRLPPAVA